MQSNPSLPRPLALPSVRRISLRRVNWALTGVLALAAALFLWRLSISGWSNTYYAAAAKAGSVSWKAWFFGSIDPGSFITVDKPPLSLWAMGLSARVFGYSAFSVLLPQALAVLGAVALLHATVRRAFGSTAGLLAAGALALTPVTVAIARVNNPDALLVLLMVLSAYLVGRAIESGRTKHLLWAGAVVGLAFMTKMLQGWMIAPALAAAYLLAGPPRLLVRVRQLALAGVAMVAVSAAWPVAVSLWPADSRPYIGGSTDGSVWNLILGYNGFGRIFGEGGGGGGGMGFGGSSGLWRMFNTQVGGQVAWLIPLALVSLLVGLWLTRRAPRVDRARAAWVLFGVWAVVHIIVFSFQQGIFHPYYTSALAPAIAALSGAGVVTMWRWARRSWAGAVVLAGSVIVTAAVAVMLLDRTPDYAPWLRVAIPAAAAIAVLGAGALRAGLGRFAAAAAVAGAIALTAGPAAYSVTTAGRALNGNNVLAGPAGASSMGGPGGGGGGMMRAGGPPSGSGAGAPRGMGGGGSVSAKTIAYLEAHQGSAKYLVAVSGSQTSASIIIATGKPVVTIGGFNGQDPAPTVAQLAAMVKRGELKYVVPSDTSSELGTWVKAHGKVVSGSLYRVSA
jgi:4-amino-4-deoxy-L-arabinose transferase-like glycosyltransferase